MPICARILNTEMKPCKKRKKKRLEPLSGDIDDLATVTMDQIWAQGKQILLIIEACLVPNDHASPEEGFWEFYDAMSKGMSVADTLAILAEKDTGAQFGNGTPERIRCTAELQLTQAQKGKPLYGKVRVELHDTKCATSTHSLFLHA